MSTTCTSERAVQERLLRGRACRSGPPALGSATHLRCPSRDSHRAGSYDHRHTTPDARSHWPREAEVFLPQILSFGVCGSCTSRNGNRASKGIPRGDLVAMRPTKVERERGRAEANRHAWESFRSKLEALKSSAEARALVAEAPPPDSPGRHYYSNLGFFLQAFTVPLGSSYAEKALYRQFIRRIDGLGELKPGLERGSMIR